MPRYINADALKADLTQAKLTAGTLMSCEVQKMMSFIDEQPTADVVEVVRCKYCKHHTYEEPGMVYCPNNIVGGWVANNFYCGDGERRE